MNGDNLSVKTMTQLTGLNEHTLRAWERRYGAVKPKRGDTGRRIYSRLDVDRLRIIASLVEHGFAIGRIATLTDQDLSQLLAQHMALNQPVIVKAQQAAAEDEEARAAELSRRIQEALSRYDLAAIHADLQTARYLLGARSFALELISPLMGHVGRLSVSGQMTIGQEHALTAIVKAHLAGITLGMAPISSTESARGPAFVLATMEGNFHEIGIMIAGVIALTRGSMIYYLGPNIPPGALADAANALKVDHILLGCSAVPPGTLPLSESQYLRELDRQLQRDTAVWLGGVITSEVRSLHLTRSLHLLGTLHELDRILATDSLRR